MAKPVSISPSESPAQKWVAQIRSDPDAGKAAWATLDSKTKEEWLAYPDVAGVVAEYGLPSAPGYGVGKEKVDGGRSRRRKSRKAGKKTKKGGRRHKKAYTRRR